ncbi:MAG: cation diffusion facilitator family transporter [Acidobacteriota bacterium]
MSDCGCNPEAAASLERRTLWVLLALNGTMFLGESLAGWWADSVGLLADSLDMLADAAVYGIALHAVRRSRQHQTRAASVSGTLQIILGAGVLGEAVRHYLFGSEPLSGLMMVVGAAALFANLTCLLLISRHRHGGIHMRASWIFSTNDVIANLGVILSGWLVRYLGSPWPDLIIGLAIALLVIRGGMRIKRESRMEALDHCQPTSA